MAVQIETGPPTTQVTVYSIGITDRDCGYPGSLWSDQTVLTITDSSVARLQFLYLQNLDFQ